MNNVTQNASDQDFGSFGADFRRFGRLALLASSVALAGLMQGCTSTTPGAPSVTLGRADVATGPITASLSSPIAVPVFNAAAPPVRVRVATRHSAAAPAAAFVETPSASTPPAGSHLARVERGQGDVTLQSATAESNATPLATPAIGTGITPRSYATLAPRPRMAPPVHMTTGEAAPDIFGSVALAVGQTPSSSSWRRVASAALPGLDGPWARVEQQARALSERDQLRLVNAYVNHAIVFTDDARLYRVSDYWATAAESLRRGQGDCEDYAIAKMQLLRALGVPSDHLYMVVARDLVRHADHALLAVRVDGRFWILDSATDLVLSADQVRDYRPILTYSDNHTWMHGYRSAPSVMMADASASSAPASGGGAP